MVSGSPSAVTGLLLIRFQTGETDFMSRTEIFEPRRCPLFELKGEALRRELSECAEARAE